jgi:sugar O-acyltransferase (sialic acid O-acetyltransferase NeuD family)
LSKVVIFGLGDFARIAQRYLESDSPHDVVAFTVHGDYLDRPELSGLPVISFEELEERYPPDEAALLVAIGFSQVNQARSRIYAECKELGYELITYVSSSAMAWPDVPIGENSFVFEANVIQPGATIGADVVLWSGNHIGHDVEIGDHCFIASHVVISGNVKIGNHCFLGVNATVRDGVTIAPRTVVGAGALIMKDTEEGAVHSVRGTPPHELKSWELKNF